MIDIEHLRELLADAREMERRCILRDGAIDRSAFSRLQDAAVNALPELLDEIERSRQGMAK